MNGQPDHPESEIAHRYVAGSLAEDEIAAFEEHLLTCGVCRDEVRQGAAIAASLRASGAAERRPAPARRIARSRRWIAPALVATAAAAAIVVLVLPRADWRVQLARLDRPPIFEPIPVRARVADGDRLVDSAMAAYTTSDFRRAREIFARVPNGGGSTGARFYFGAAALADGAPAVARAPLERVVADSISPFASPARVLLAKALLGVGDVDSAVATVAGSTAPDVRAFADSLRALRRPPRD